MIRSGKLFILTLLALLHFASAYAMEKEKDLGDIIENIKSIKVVDRPDITYDGRVGYGAMYQGLDVYKNINKSFKPVKDYFVYSEEETKSYKRRTSPRLYDLLLTRWERKKTTIQHKCEDIKDGLIVLWNILPSSVTTTSKDPRKQLYAMMRQESYMMSLENLLTHLKEDNDLYYYETFPSNLHKKLQAKMIREIWCQNGLLSL